MLINWRNKYPKRTALLSDYILSLRSDSNTRCRSQNSQAIMYLPAVLTVLLPSALAVMVARAMPNLLTLSLSDEEETLGLGNEHPACLRACMDERPACPVNMEAHNLGSCWTCCLLPQNEEMVSTHDPNVAADLFEAEGEIGLSRLTIKGATKGSEAGAF
ncbi:hypothetical protein BJX61DRAFT_497879 [Aspergillus egyptiacus]|nr:hypothetical protein BJX61DRAFT_497879 [Aspergillus egyptiacus]